MSSGGRKLSFDVLAISQDDDEMSATTIFSRSNSDPLTLQNGGTSSPSLKKKRRRRRIKKGQAIHEVSSLVSDDSEINEEIRNYSCTVSTITEETEGEVNYTVRTVTPVFQELRQRNVSNVINGGEMGIFSPSDEGGNSKKDENVQEEEEKKNERVGNEINLDQKVELKGGKLQEEQSLDWKKLMVEDPSYALPLGKSPMEYFREEICAGNTLRSTTTLGNDKERERVYDTIFHLPWRCELLINIGFFVCFDSFLSLLTIMPTRIMMTVWRLLKTSSRGLLQRSCLIMAASLSWLAESLCCNKQISA